MPARSGRSNVPTILLLATRHPPLVPALKTLFPLTPISQGLSLERPAISENFPPCPPGFPERGGTKVLFPWYCGPIHLFHEIRLSS
jgi:hypothetical protein